MAQISIYVREEELAEILRVLETSEDHDVDFSYVQKPEHVNLLLNSEEHFKLLNNSSVLSKYLSPRNRTAVIHKSAKNLTETLDTIIEQKNLIVRSQKYEWASYVRDIEKRLVNEVEEITNRANQDLKELEKKHLTKN